MKYWFSLVWTISTITGAQAASICCPLNGQAAISVLCDQPQISTVVEQRSFVPIPVQPIAIIDPVDIVQVTYSCGLAESSVEIESWQESFPLLAPVEHAVTITAPNFTIGQTETIENFSQFGVVPEPSTATLGVISLILLWRRRMP
ncbi:hypothetical protein HW115_09740 [Verrucomicrobiaceae bacterium N1E253]|uniref:PEP-CTERM protein-sorting domain-containing protein n=1 Tax=Oceaniferula marina TaxID=2748318 RepID=A0A851GEB8_9BACT|nr:hypothetical protein [Oceaniferula marina]NWK55893.1 hypothetical protein [Oceaniferula marina]